MTTNVVSAQVGRAEAGPDDFFEWAYEQGWTDGLPVVAPTPERVRAMMATIDLPADHVVARIPPKLGPATVERLAANAVMAGCRPEYFPVIVAATESVMDAAEMLNTTTNAAAPMFIVNGPIRNELGMNCSWSCMGPGNRANATIGRAMSLIMINIGGRIPGEVSKSTFAQPGRYTFCFSEYEEESPWEPLHVERGFRSDESTVTMHAVTGTINSIDIDSKTAEGALHTHANSMKVIGTLAMFPGYGSNIGMVFCPPHAKLIGERYTKQQAKEMLCEEANRIPRRFETEERIARMIEQGRGQVEGEYLRILERPDDILIVVAGGHGGHHSIITHGFGGDAVTVPIKHRRT